MLILLPLRRRSHLSWGLDFIILVALILLRYIDNFVAALATARILIALRGAALFFYDGAVFSAAMVTILALLLPPRCLYHYYGRFDFDGRDIDGLDGARIWFAAQRCRWSFAHPHRLNLAALSVFISLYRPMHSLGAADRVVVLPSARRYHAPHWWNLIWHCHACLFPAYLPFKIHATLASRFTRPALVPTVQPFAVQIRHRTHID